MQFSPNKLIYFHLLQSQSFHLLVLIQQPSNCPFALELPAINQIALCRSVKSCSHSTMQLTGKSNVSSHSFRVGPRRGSLPLPYLLCLGKNVQLIKNLVRVYLSQTDIIPGKQNLNGLRKCSEEWRFCSPFYTLQSKE